MNKVFVSIVIVFVLVAGLLVSQALKGGTSEVFLPSQLLAEGQGSALARVRVGGRVSADVPIDYSVQPQISLKFSLVDPGPKPGAPVPVIYNGLKPDMFTAGRDVIIDGEYSGGVILASRLLTQCPSKYEPPIPGQAPARAGSDT